MVINKHNTNTEKKGRQSVPKQRTQYSKTYYILLSNNSNLTTNKSMKQISLRDRRLLGLLIPTLTIFEQKYSGWHTLLN